MDLGETDESGPNNVLEVVGLEKSFPGFRLNVSLSIAAGEILALIGPNGSGKSTLIYGLLNIVRRDQGAVRFFGLDLDSNEEAIKRDIGVFLEDPRLFEDMRIKDLAEFFRAFYPSWNDQYLADLLRGFNLDARKRFKKLSKGMKAMAAISLALAPMPRVLILDEPTAAFDPGVRKSFVRLVREAKKRFSPAILLTSHIMSDVEALADTIAFIDAGRIKLIEGRETFKSWRVVEGVGRRPPAFDAIAIDLEVEGHPEKFKFMTRRGDDDFVEELRASGAEITEVSTPDLEKIYDCIISADS